MAVVARLHCLVPPDPDTARVLELGCGDGGNLLAIAAARPGAELIGFDAEPTAICRGQELAAAAGLDRVVLSAAPIRDLSPADLGPVDYVVIHGLWSWVLDDVREAALALARAVLAPRGVVAISYNALPGWHLWMAPRAIARRAAAGQADPAAAAAAAIGALTEAANLHGSDDLYGRMLRRAVERARARPPELFFHDDLADECTAFSVEEVAARARRHGLRYLGEALPEHWWPARVAPGSAERIRAAGTDALSRQWAADLASGVDFKGSLFVRDEMRPAAEIDPIAALELFIAARHDPPPLPDGTAPAVRSLFEGLASAAPAFRPLRQAGEEAALAERTTAGAALRLVADGLARFAVSPPEMAEAPDTRPHASALAREQVARGPRLATLLHEVVTLDDPGARALLRLLDGSVESPALPELLTKQEPNVASEDLPAAVTATLRRFAEVGLLTRRTSI
jgi:SAM-dependent methyltransferase